MPPFELKDRSIQCSYQAEDEYSSGRDDFYLQRLGKKPTLKVRLVYSYRAHRLYLGTVERG